MFVSKVAWNGTAGDWQRVVQVAESAGAEVVLGEWSDEASHRTAALAEMKSRGVRHAIIPDDDEVIEPALLATLKAIAVQDLADNVRARMDTYWKSEEFVIRPREIHLRHAESPDELLRSHAIPKGWPTTAAQVRYTTLF